MLVFKYSISGTLVPIVIILQLMILFGQINGDHKGWKVRTLYQMKEDKRSKGKHDFMSHRLCGNSVSRRIEQ